VSAVARSPGASVENRRVWGLRLGLCVVVVLGSSQLNDYGIT